MEPRPRFAGNWLVAEIRRLDVTTLSAEVGRALDATGTSYEQALTRPPKPVLTDLVGRMSARLETLADRRA